LSAATRALVAALLFGASAPICKVLLSELGPFQVSGLLYLGAAVATFPVQVREPDRVALRRLDQRNRWRLVGAIGAGGILGPVLLMLGLERASAASVSLMLNGEMAATAVLGVLFFGDSLSRLGWVGVAGIVGAGALISGGAGWPGVAAAGLVGMACACWGLDNHWTAQIDGMSPARSTFWKGLIAGCFNTAIGWIPAAPDAPWTTLSAALAVGALSYGASITLYIRSSQELGATRAQALFAAAPFLGALIAWVGLREPIGWELVAGTLLLISSVSALFWGQHDHLHEHDPIYHTHRHWHDDGHHDHDHADDFGPEPHAHWHRHARLVHRHPHWPDLHHRHSHG